MSDRESESVDGTSSLNSRWAPRLSLSYRVHYRIDMAKRSKRSVSLPTELAIAIDRAAEKAGETFSGWLAATATRRLRIEAGRRGVAQWERANGALTKTELDDGRARARALLGAG